MSPYALFSRGGWRFIVATWFLGFAMWGTLVAIAPVLVVISQELTLNFADMGLVFSVPVFMLAIFAPIGGFLTDKFGSRMVGTLGALLIGVGGLLRGFSVDYTTLIIFSAAFGLGWGLALPTLPKTVGGWFDRKLTGTVTGIYMAGTFAGAGAGGFATAVVFVTHWRGATIAWGIITLIVGLTWWILIRDAPQKKTKKSLSGSYSDLRVWLLTLILLFGATFTFWALTGWLPTVLTTLVTPNATTIASLLAFSGAPASLIMPALSDKLRRRKPFILTFSALGGLATYMLFNVPAYIEPAVVATLGFAISTIAVMCFILPIELVPEENIGSATGIMLFGYIGGIIGPWLVGYTRDVTGSFNLAMIMIIVAFLVSSVLSLALPETGRRARSA